MISVISVEGGWVWRFIDHMANILWADQTVHPTDHEAAKAAAKQRAAFFTRASSIDEFWVAAI